MMDVIERAKAVGAEIRNVIESVDPAPLSLADAIREGSKFVEQALGEWCDEDGNLCALSTALASHYARTSSGA